LNRRRSSPLDDPVSGIPMSEEIEDDVVPIKAERSARWDGVTLPAIR